MQVSYVINEGLPQSAIVNQSESGDPSCLKLHLCLYLVRYGHAFLISTYIWCFFPLTHSLSFSLIFIVIEIVLSITDFFLLVLHFHPLIFILQTVLLSPPLDCQLREGNDHVYFLYDHVLTSVCQVRNS